MNIQERLRQSIDEHEHCLRASVPAGGEATVLAVLRAQNRASDSSHAGHRTDFVTGRNIANPGANKALQLCLEATEVETPAANERLDGWADRFLQDCGALAEAGLVLDHCETGFMRMVADGSGDFDAWIATKREPASWRERADFDWWAASLAERDAPELRNLLADRPEQHGNDSVLDTFYRELAALHLNMMTCQIGYPTDAILDGCTVQTYLDILSLLIGWSLRARDGGDVALVQSEQHLVAAIASALAIEVDVVGKAVTAMTLDRESAAYHAEVPGVAAAPLVRVAPDRLILSAHGLTSQPLLFLTRELRRRAAQDYHNSGHLREDVFRQDLYSLFQDKRFVTSSGRIELRRAGGNLRTDIDAAVFDRKTGTLALFELKSQDPFARSSAELLRRRDNVLYANRQVSGVLDWIKRQGADEILNRVDHRTAKKFRVQKVYPFVLARYLVQFNNGPVPDRRAAWGTWPQVMRLLDGQPERSSDTNPLATLFTRLGNDNPIIRVNLDESAHEIELGSARLTVYSSFAAFQNASA